MAVAVVVVAVAVAVAAAAAAAAVVVVVVVFLLMFALLPLLVCTFAQCRYAVVWRYKDSDAAHLRQSQSRR
jgi:hypothetical protein